MPPPNPPKAGEPIADWLKAIEEELEADPANDPSRQ